MMRGALSQSAGRSTLVDENRPRVAAGAALDEQTFRQCLVVTARPVERCEAATVGQIGCDAGLK